MTVFYNVLMLLVAGLMVRHGARRPSASSVLLALAVVGAGAAVLAGTLASSTFGAMRLLAWGVFFHGFLALAGLALVLRRAHRRAALASAIGALLVIIVAVDAFLIEPYWLEVSRVRVASPKIRQPLRIGVLTDFQTDRIGRYEHSVLRRLMNEKPDLILLPGDYLSANSQAELQALRRRFRALLAKVGFHAPLGIYAVRGDVERDGWQQTFAGFPVVTLDQTRTIELPGLSLTGLSVLQSADPRLHIARREGFHIVFGHRPDYALGDVQADLLVAGHTHGGQVRLPFIGPLITLSRVPRAWAAGVTPLPGNRTLVVARGTGMERGAAPRIRFLCRPELVLIELVPETPAAQGE